MGNFRQFAFKQFGYLDFENNLLGQLGEQNFSDFIKIVFLRAGAKITIDFNEYKLEQDALFFINPGQYHSFSETCCGTMIYYNRDFYCVEIHDKEVACDGILFHNVYEIPVIFIKGEESAGMQKILTEIKAEFQSDESGMEEMLRILLKQLIIKSTRIWKQERYIVNQETTREADFLRSFSQIIEWNYTRLHSVAAYAQLLHISPKALNKRITRHYKTTPNDIIKNRIILEAKRLLVHTSLSVKEIGYKLGYDDASYFVRFFSKQTAISPYKFRSQYQ